MQCSAERQPELIIELLRSHVTDGHDQAAWLAMAAVNVNDDRDPLAVAIRRDGKDLEPTVVMPHDLEAQGGDFGQAYRHCP